MTDLSRTPTSAHRAGRSAARFRRLTSLPVRRVAATLLVAGLLLSLTFLLASPFSRPKAQLVVFAPPQYAASRVLNISSGQVLSSSFAPLTDVLYQQSDQKGPILLPNLATVTQARTIQQDLGRVLSPQIDVAIFYLAAHGVSQGEDAYLLCGDFDPTTSHLGRYSLSDLLQQLRECPAELKLLILDAGQFDHDPRWGLILNEFPRLLEEEVHRAGDPNLWVLTSNQLLERSHVCYADQKSIFHEALVLGLQGAADADGDREIELDELTRYVTANVSTWVRQHTLGAESQTPRLIWGGGPGTPPETDQVLLPVPRRLPAPAPVALAATKSKAKAVSAATAAKQTKVPPRVANAIRPSTPSSRSRQTSDDVAKNPNSDEFGDKAPATTASASPDAQPAAPASGTTVIANATGPATSPPGIVLPKDVPEAAPPLPPPPAANASLPELLQAAWRLRDSLESRAGGRPSPVDYAPHLWRQFEDRLLVYEAIHRANGDTGDATLVKALREELLTLPKLIASNVPLELDNRSSIAQRIALLYPRPPAALSDPRSLALASALSWSSPALSAGRIRDLSAQLEYWTTSRPERRGIQQVARELDARGEGIV